ncbi:DUF6456 domain-containing protein [Chelativorans sp.]|uniref:DUF6456 domain-containing protein n=1 Tax=Chelativorans sp. TaxID=2203393 RepID=UPI0028123A23|nr:DUF6456 domain-containing protein [Chelativorans sp.]
MEKKLPSIRIDGGRRIDLKARRECRGLVLNSPERTPVDRAAAQRELRREQRSVARLIGEDGGKEGAKVSSVKVRDLQGQRARTLVQAVRSRPGTFEWRYGRDKQSALYHAGSHFAQLWERAGIAIASSADFLRGTMAGYPAGKSDSRLDAQQKVSDAVREIGRYSAERLISYCVIGETAASLARKHGQSDRDMAAVLHQDLRAVAMHFRFL